MFYQELEAEANFSRAPLGACFCMRVGDEKIVARRQNCLHK